MSGRKRTDYDALITVLCEACGGEGRIFKSRYGGNDPDVWDAGPCAVCDGTSYVDVPAEPATMEEIDLPPPSDAPVTDDRGRPDATGGVSISGVDGATGTGGGAVLSAAHVGDPCFYCNVPHDDVPIAACEGRTRYPWGHPYRLGRQQAMCGQSRLNPEFFRGEKDQAAYVAGYDGAPCP